MLGSEGADGTTVLAALMIKLLQVKQRKSCLLPADSFDRTNTN